MSKHTPGPWTVGPAFDNDGQPEIIIEHQTPAGNLVVAVALAGLQGQEANARLIAAAPDLLEALEHIMRCIPMGGFAQIHHGSSTWEQIDAAVSKARGELPNTEAVRHAAKEER